MDEPQKAIEADTAEGKSAPLFDGEQMATIMEESMKLGARHSTRDQKHLQSIHDSATLLGAMCPAEEDSKSIGPDEILLAFGGAIKALGDGKIGGYLVRFTDAEHPDLDGDYFDKTTDFGIEPGDPINIYYNHGLDSVLKKRRLGRGAVDVQDSGLWMEAQLELRDDYERAIYAMVEAGKMGWSSGSMPHLIERIPTKSAKHVTHWPIGEGSITPTPAAGPIYTQIQPLKTWAEATQSLKALFPETGRSPVVDGENEHEAEPIRATKQTHREATMGNDEKQTPEVIVKSDPTLAASEQLKSILGDWQMKQIDPLNTKVDSLSDTMTKILQFMQDEPAIRKGGYFTEDGGKADKDIKSFGDFLLAVKRHDVQRLVKVYGAQKTLAEDAGDTGGYLVPAAYSTDLLAMTLNLSDTNQIIPRCTQVPVGMARAGEFPVLDVFTAPTTAGSGQSSLAGGMSFTGVVTEGETVGETEPRFEMLRWTLYKRGGIVPVSNELNTDSPMAIETLLRGLAAVAIRNQIERDIIRGPGGGAPVGILNAGALIEVSAVTSSVFGFGDVGNLYSRFKAMGGPPVWLMHPGVWPDILGMTVSTGVAAYQANPQSPAGNGLLGYPIVNSEHSPQANNTGDVILADLKSYLLFMRGEFEVAFSEHAYFTTDRVGWRFVQRVDGMPWLRSSITLADPQGAYTVSPFVAHND